MKQQNILWIFGPSATGKRTLGKSLEDNPQHPLNIEYGLDNPTFVWVPGLRRTGDTIEENQARRIQAIDETLASGRDVIVHGQFIDIPTVLERYSATILLLTCTPEIYIRNTTSRKGVPGDRNRYDQDLLKFHTLLSKFNYSEHQSE